MERWVIILGLLAAVLGGCHTSNSSVPILEPQLPNEQDVQNAATMRLALAPTAQTSSVEGTVVVSGFTVLDTNGLPVPPTQAASKVMARLVDPEDDILATVYPNGFGKYRIDYQGSLPSGKLRFSVRVQQDLNGDGTGGDTLEQVVPVKLALGRVSRVNVNFSLGTQADLGPLPLPPTGAALITQLTTEDASGFNEALYGILYADGTVVYDQDKDGTLEPGDDYSAPDTSRDGVPDASEGAISPPAAEIRSITGLVRSVDLAAHSLTLRDQSNVDWLVIVDPFTAIEPFSMPPSAPGSPGSPDGGADEGGAFLGGVPFDANLVGQTVIVEGTGTNDAFNASWIVLIEPS